MRSTETNLTDYATRRRRYLAEVARLQAVYWMYLIGAGLMAFVACCAGTFTLLVLFMIPRGGENAASFVCWLMITALICLGTRSSACAASRALQQSRSLPHVPPVREQISGLRAEQVLVRGSEPPAVSDAHLLRPAGDSNANEETELLRVSEYRQP